jgi:hypothetical protein
MSLRGSIFPVFSASVSHTKAVYQGTGRRSSAKLDIFIGDGTKAKLKP